MSYPVFCDLVKGLYVSVAADEFALADKAQTDSRITLLTGVHRKEVKRLRETTGDEEMATQHFSISTALIGSWLASPDLVNSEGHPKPLPRSGPPGAPSFAALAEAISQDIRPRVILDELERLGVVRIDQNDFVHLDKAALVPRAGYDQMALIFGQNLRDHIQAATNNLEGRHKPFLERAVIYSGMRPDSVQRIAEMAERIGMQALINLNREAHRLAEQDKGHHDADRRFTFGAYFFTEAAAASTSDSRSNGENAQS